MTPNEMQKRDPAALDASEQTRPGPVWSPAVDIFENDDRITVLADLPGVRSQDLTVDLRDSVLTLSGRVGVAAGGNEAPVLREWTAGTFFRRFTLAESVDQTKIDAKLADGVLRLELPKVERARPRQIAVRGA
jgi:HSP20 family molecular chaperone IbpA